MRINGDTNYWRHDGRNVDVVDRAQAGVLYTLYFQAETTIIVHVSSNSESDTEDVRSRKVYTTPLARAKGKTFFRCCMLLRARSKLQAEQDSARYTRKPRTTPSNTTTRPHPPWPRYTIRVWSIEVTIKSLLNILVAYHELFKLLRTKNGHREFLESRIVTVNMVDIILYFHKRGVHVPCIDFNHIVACMPGNHMTQSCFAQARSPTQQGHLGRGRHNTYIYTCIYFCTDMRNCDTKFNVKNKPSFLACGFHLEPAVMNGYTHVRLIIHHFIHFLSHTYMYAYSRTIDWERK